MILHNTKLKNELKKIEQKYPELVDVLVFGSVVRGKVHPTDVDILVLFKRIVDKSVEYVVRKVLERYIQNISIISKVERAVCDATFDARESVLFEAKSLLTGKNRAQEYGFSSFGMFKYGFGRWSTLQKTKFYYALNGRGTRGIIDTVQGIKLADSVIIVPLEFVEEFRRFLERWKIEFVYVPMIIPTRMGKKSILG